MPASFPVADSLVGPVVAQLALVAGQIQGMGRVYTEPPEGEPEDNSVVFPLKGYEVVDDTNGKLKVRLTFEVMHFFRRSRLQDSLARAQAFLPAWMSALADYGNTTLGGLAISTTLQRGSLASSEWGRQVYIVLSHTVTVLTEFNIPLT